MFSEVILCIGFFQIAIEKLKIRNYEGLHDFYGGLHPFKCAFLAVLLVLFSHLIIFLSKITDVVVLGY